MTKSPLRRHVRAALAAACLALLLMPGGDGAAQAPAPAPAALSIEHRAPACAQAGQYARLDACFRPASALARARVYFRKVGTAEWFYVDMRPDAPCHRGILPRPRKDIGRIEYYLSATDRTSSETRTPDHTVLVTETGQCPSGPMAPVANGAGGAIGSASGAAPVGFVAGGGVSTPLLVGGAAIVGGGAAVLIAGGGDETPTTTTTTTTTTTSTTTTSTTSTTTTTTTEPPRPPTTTTTTTTTTLCESPNQNPVANVIAPVTGQLPGTSVEIRATADDPAPGSGIREVRFYYYYRPLSGDGPRTFIGSDNSGPSPYTITWTLPSCGAAPEDRFRLIAQPVDNCGNVGADAGVDVRSVGRGCFRAPGGPGPVPDEPVSGTWQSDLRGSEARGQVIVDGATAVFPGEGAEPFAAALGPGVHRFEATLVAAPRDAGDGVPTWRFDLGGLRVRPGTLRVVAGQAVQAAASEVTFRLRGQPGERVVFEFEL